MGKNVIVTDEAIENAYRIMARIVRDQGQKYLPVFKRLHEEYQEQQAKRDLTNIALQIATLPD